MIRNFGDRTTQDLYHSVNSRHARKVAPELHGKAQRLLDQINAAPRPEVLGSPPGNHQEKLSGDRAGYWSVRINKQWRIVFRWEQTDALDVQIVDYHR